MTYEEVSEDREILVLYATETGNAEDTADKIARECRRIQVRCRVVDIESYSLVRRTAFLKLNYIDTYFSAARHVV
jgi:sulfite reductase alpha subunit-like flavoprotein